MGWFDTTPGTSADEWAMLGVDPSQVRAQQFGDILQQLGIGLLSGNNWGQGLAKGFAGAAQAAPQARQRALSEGVDRFRVKKYMDEAADYKKFQDMPAPKGVDPAEWASAPMSMRPGIYERANAPMKAPNIETIYEGDQAVQGYFDGEGQFVKVGGGRRFAPNQGPAPQRLPLTATFWDPSANNGKGGEVYATGELKGQLASNPNQASANPSSDTEQYNRLITNGYSQQDATALVNTNDPNAIMALRPVNPPLAEDGSVDTSNLDTETRYAGPDGKVYRWDGSQFYEW